MSLCGAVERSSSRQTRRGDAEGCEACGGGLVRVAEAVPRLEATDGEGMRGGVDVRRT